jgi:hypothetical protein
MNDHSPGFGQTAPQVEVAMLKQSYWPKPPKHPS